MDFHRSCLIGWRFEAQAERQDAITVWLRASDKRTKLIPIAYRVVQETRIGPSYSAYLGGDLVDDYLGQPGSQGTAWGNQAGPYAKIHHPPLRGVTRRRDRRRGTTQSAPHRAP